MAARANKEMWLLVLGLPLTLAVLGGGVYFGLTHPLYTIPSESGIPTILNGDLILARGSKYACGSIRPQPGDLVVYRRKDTSYLKRLVGVPGDRVQFQNGVLLVNGRPAPQTIERQTTLNLGGFSTKADILRETLPNGRSYEVALVDRTNPQENTLVATLGQDQYYLVGDSRDNSLDSRFDGPTPKANLCAVAVRVLNSPDRTHVWKPL